MGTRQEIKTKVRLTVTHSVWVTVRADVSDSVADIRDRATRTYREVQRSSLLGMNVTAWRSLFSNRSDIEVSSEQVEIADITTTEIGPVMHEVET